MAESASELERRAAGVLAEMKYYGQPTDAALGSAVQQQQSTAAQKRPSKAATHVTASKRKKTGSSEAESDGSSSSSSDDEDGDDSEGSETEEETETKPVLPATVAAMQEPAPVKKETLPEKDAMGTESWNDDDIEVLLARITTVLPTEDTAKYSTQVERINWGKVAFKNYSAVDCREKWGIVATKVRKYRTLTELVNDAKYLHAHPKVNAKTARAARLPAKACKVKVEAHPDRPKKPLTPFFKFFCEKRPKYATLNPDLSTTDISKLLSVKFKELPEAKKQKYIDDFNKETEEYKKALEKFKADHPELVPETNGVEKQKSPTELTAAGQKKPAAAKKDVPPKGTTPQLIYVHIKTEEALKHDPKVSRKQCLEQFRQEYSHMTDEEKLPYIELAMKAFDQYEKDCNAYIGRQPESEFKPTKTFLNKTEQKIKDAIDGKPIKPPPNGYGLFSMYLLPKLTELPSNERMAEVSRRWKGLSPEEREDFNHEVIEKNNEFKKSYKEYLDKLTPAERRRIMEEESSKKHGAQKENVPVKKAVTVSERKKQQPVSAMFLFLEEKRAKYKVKYPDMDHQELTRLLAKEFSALPDDKKAKYKKLEQERKAQIIHDQEEDDDEEEEKEKTDVKKKKRRFPGEPKKPPSSGYAMFSTEQLSSGVLKGVQSTQRMGVLSQKWHAMSEATRDSYKASRDALNLHYQKELEKFLARLSNKDRLEWEDCQKRRKPIANSKTKKPVKEETESSDEDDSDDDDASDSEMRPLTNGPNKAAHDSDSESGSDDSDGSDSDSDSSDSE